MPYTCIARAQVVDPRAYARTSTTRAHQLTTTMGLSPETIARVFHESSFSRSDTRITASTVALSAEYINHFVAEAVARSNYARLHEAPVAVDGIDNVAAGAVPSGEEEADADDSNGDFTVDSGADSDGDSDHGPPDSNTLDTRHLRAIAGVLVLDF